MSHVRLPLTDSQLEVWLAAQRGDRANTGYNASSVVRLDGVLDSDRLTTSVQQCVRWHEALRTEIDATGSSQRVHDHIEIELPVVDLRPLAEPERETAVRELVIVEENHVFDLTSAPLARFLLVRLDERAHMLVITVHHVIADGWAINVLIRDIAANYRAFQVPEDEPSSQLTDYVRWQQSVDYQEERREAENYWLARFADGFPRLTLPPDRSGQSREGRGERQRAELPAATVAGLRELGNRNSATLFATLLAGFSAFLYRLTGQGDFVTAVSYVGRRFPEDTGLVAHCVNLLPVRLSGAARLSFEQWLRVVRDELLDAHEHGQYPWLRLTERLGLTASNRSPLLPVTFNVETNGNPDFGPLTAVVQTPDHPRGAPRDLSFFFLVEDERLVIDAIYDSGLYAAGTVRGWITAVIALLAGVVANPGTLLDRLPLVSARDQARMLTEWNPTGTGFPAERCVHELFADQVRRTPDATAVECGANSLTYAELDRRAEGVAAILRERGVTAEVMVGVCLTRSIELVVAMLGVLKAGGAYVPLAHDYPTERLAFMLADSAAPIVVSSAELADRVPGRPGLDVVLIEQTGGAAAPRRAAPVRSANLAYVTYTSGSTGRPKGVLVSHRNIVRLLSPMSYASIDETDAVLVTSAIPFDVLTFELWGALLCGARAVMLSAELTSVEEIGRTIARHRITSAWFIAGLFHRIVDTAPELLAPLRQVMAGGEALSPEHCARVLAELPHLRLINGYGPTEGTTFTTAWDLPPSFPADSAMAIGRPIDNTRVYVLGPDLRPTPVGMAGELYIAGEGVARGYFARPGLTADRFLPDPFSPEPGGRMYRSGDRSRYRPDGTIEFLGRMDEQVKVRGYRIELGEIQSVLAEHPDVRQAVVTVREDVPGDPLLVGYVVSDTELPEQGQALREYLRTRLPAYMVPATVLRIRQVPLSPQGKLDRAALPAPWWGSRHPHTQAVPPTTPVQRRLVAMWAEVMGVDEVGVTDDLFEVGAHSLHAMRVVSRLLTELKVEIPLRQIFDTPTVAELAVVVEREIRAGLATMDRPSLAGTGEG